MTDDTLADELEALIEDLETVSIETISQTSLEVYCALVGGFIHGYICADDTITAEQKAAVAVVTIARHLTAAAIDHFEVVDLKEQIELLVEAGNASRVH